MVEAVVSVGGGAADGGVPLFTASAGDGENTRLAARNRDVARRAASESAVVVPACARARLRLIVRA